MWPLVSKNDVHLESGNVWGVILQGPQAMHVGSVQHQNQHPCGRGTRTMSAGQGMLKNHENFCL
jgi:hypothetical protein